LLEAAKRIEDFYGVGYFSVTERQQNGTSTQKNIAFAEMSVTQRQEILGKALEHARAKYKILAPKVRNRSSVIGASYAGATVSHEIVYDFGDGNDTYRDKDGKPRVRRWREEWDFLGELNGNVTQSMNYTPNHGVGGYQSHGSQMVQGEGIGNARGAFGQWQTVLDEHREELRLAETSYNGEIRRYMDRIRFMKQSLTNTTRHSVALLDFSDTHVQIRDLRTARPGTPPDNNQLSCLEGEWADASHTTFVVRAVTGADGKRVLLNAPATINLDTDPWFYGGNSFRNCNHILISVPRNTLQTSTASSRLHTITE
jgi:hypothetical protein